MIAAIIVWFSTHNSHPHVNCGWSEYYIPKWNVKKIWLFFSLKWTLYEYFRLNGCGLVPIIHTHKCDSVAADDFFIFHIVMNHHAKFGTFVRFHDFLSLRDSTSYLGERCRWTISLASRKSSWMPRIWTLVTRRPLARSFTEWVAGWGRD